MVGVIWAIVALLMFVVQFGAGIFDFLFPAIAALLTAVLSFTIPGLASLWWLQIGIWALSTFGSVFFLRRRLGKLFKGELLDSDRDRLANVGQKALVLEDIRPGKEGRIKFHGTSWKASSLDEEIPAGLQVYIMEQQGMSFLVSRKLFEDEEQANKELDSILQKDLPAPDSDKQA